MLLDKGHPILFISIHALREEGDIFRQNIRNARVISIHALREEGDLLLGAGSTHDHKFLSTPSARRATPAGRR